jgi:hypothetical protein
MQALLVTISCRGIWVELENRPTIAERHRERHADFWLRTVISGLPSIRTRALFAVGVRISFRRGRFERARFLAAQRPFLETSNCIAIHRESVHKANCLGSETVNEAHHCRSSALQFRTLTGWRSAGAQQTHVVDLSMRDGVAQSAIRRVGFPGEMVLCSQTSLNPATGGKLP